MLGGKPKMPKECSHPEVVALAVPFTSHREGDMHPHSTEMHLGDP